MDFAVWLAGDGRQSCGECRKAYERASRPTPWDKAPPAKKDPPCSTCRPDLDDEAELPAEVLLRVQRQWLLDRRGVPMGLRIEAVESVIRQLWVPEDQRLALSDVVMRLGDVMAEIFNRKVERE